LSRCFRAEVAENRSLNKHYRLLTFIPSEPAIEPEPGQFYMIGKCAGESEPSSQGLCGKNTYDPLLKRPFSLFRKASKGLQILYRIRGKGTAMMGDMKKGFVIHVLGPLGNSYPMPPKDHTPLIVAGGIGIASLFSLAERLAGKTYIFYGTRVTDELVMLEELKGLAKMLYITTDDGSCGERGCITDVVRNFISDGLRSGGGYSMYACGPRPMMEAVGSIVKDKGIATYVSMEENMACGIGACLGCVVKTVSGHKRVCKEGPVFSIDEIVW
jgi:dihydroorotate dehydrogenase electron transfer subunit